MGELERKISRTSDSLTDLYDAALESGLHIMNPGLFCASREGSMYAGTRVAGFPAVVGEG